MHTLETVPSISKATEAQECREQRNQLRGDTESKFSLVNAHVNIVVNTDTEQAMESLEEIYELIDRASTIRLRSSLSEPPLLLTRDF
ncbi:unnamed protein product [Strongylus vulgaris]|uniref:Uncharacterized protein n=1 Tax=Strongylus vulgaris TaxID=40348 RepID=A0A3P7IYW6_STRVU|nr:unnamed protein product [Strongylus vulgaris]